MICLFSFIDDPCYIIMEYLFSYAGLFGLFTVLLHFYASGHFLVRSEITAACDGRKIILDQTLPSVNLTATNSNAGSAGSCYWDIHSPANTEIIIKFFEVKLYDTDRIEVGLFDTSVQYRRLLVTNDLRRSPSPIYIGSTNAARVKFEAHSTYSQSLIELEASFIPSLTFDESAVVSSQGGYFTFDATAPSMRIESADLAYTLDDVYLLAYWYISSPVGTKLQITYHSLNLPQGVYFNVYNRIDRIDRISSFSNTDTVPGITITGNKATLELNSNYKYLSGSLNFTVSKQDHSRSEIDGLCGGVFALDEMEPIITFSTPLYNHPSEKEIYMTCNMYITSPVGKQVQFTLLHFETFSSETLAIYDHLRDAFSEYRVTTLQGSLNNTANFLSSRGGFIVSLGDDSFAKNGRGFLATVHFFDSAPSSLSGFCGGAIILDERRPSITFSSPLYNSGSETDLLMDCTMFITSSSMPTGKQIQLTLSDVETSLETLSIYDHKTYVHSSSRVATLEGILNSTANFLSIRGGFILVLDDKSFAKNGRGFFAVAHLSESSSELDGFCGGTIILDESRPNTTFSTPLYTKPSEEYLLMNCKMFITGPNAKQVLLTILNYDTSSSQELTIYDHRDVDYYSTSIFSLQGTLNNRTNLISSLDGYALFFEDEVAASNGRGFIAQAYIIDGPPSHLRGFCAGVLTLDESRPSITFSTPFYNTDSETDLLMDCTVSVTSPNEKQVQLTLLDFRTSPSESLSIYNHPTSASSSYHVSTLQGILNTTVNIFSSRGGLLLNFDDKDFAPNGPGFLAQVQIIGDAPHHLDGFCGGYAVLSETTPEITFSTPFIRNTYASSVVLNCHMYFKSPPGYAILVTLLDVNSPNDDIFVYDGNLQISELSGRLEEPVSFLSNLSKLYIGYEHNGDAVSGPQFPGTARIIAPLRSKQEGFCGGQIWLDNAFPRVQITTPLYYFSPSVSNLEMNCWWYIISSTAKEVELSFKQVETENEVVRVYDHPKYSWSSYQVLMLIGNVGEASCVSTRGGIVIYYEDQSPGPNGRGFRLDAKLEGLPDEVTTAAQWLPSTDAPLPTQDIQSTHGQTTTTTFPTPPPLTHTTQTDNTNSGSPSTEEQPTGRQTIISSISTNPSFTTSTSKFLTDITKTRTSSTDVLPRTLDDQPTLGKTTPLSKAPSTSKSDMTKPGTSPTDVLPRTLDNQPTLGKTTPASKAPSTSKSDMTKPGTSSTDVFPRTLDDQPTLGKTTPASKAPSTSKSDMTKPDGTLTMGSTTKQLTGVNPKYSAEYIVLTIILPIIGTIATITGATVTVFQCCKEIRSGSAVKMGDEECSNSEPSETPWSGDEDTNETTPEHTYQQRIYRTGFEDEDTNEITPEHTYQQRIYRTGFEDEDTNEITPEHTYQQRIYRTGFEDDVPTFPNQSGNGMVNHVYAEIPADNMATGPGIAMNYLNLQRTESTGEVSI